MSERDVRRIGGLSEVISERRTIASAAALLAMSAQHLRRLLRRLMSDGGTGMGHKSLGWLSNRRIQTALRDHALALVREHNPDLVRRWRPRSQVPPVALPDLGLAGATPV